MKEGVVGSGERSEESCWNDSVLSIQLRPSNVGGRLVLLLLELARLFCFAASQFRAAAVAELRD